MTAERTVMLPEKECLGKAKVNKKDKRNLKPLAPASRENIKYSPTPSQVNINPHARGLSTYLTSYYLIHHIWLSHKNYKV